MTLIPPAYDRHKLIGMSSRNFFLACLRSHIKKSANKSYLTISPDHSLHLYYQRLRLSLLPFPPFWNVIDSCLFCSLASPCASRHSHDKTSTQAQLSGGLWSYRCETVIIPGRLRTTESVMIESAWEIACLISGWHVYFTRIVHAHHSSAMVESNAPGEYSSHPCSSTMAGVRQSSHNIV